MYTYIPRCLIQGRKLSIAGSGAWAGIDLITFFVFEENACAALGCCRQIIVATIYGVSFLSLSTAVTLQFSVSLSTEYSTDSNKKISVLHLNSWLKQGTVGSNLML